MNRILLIDRDRTLGASLGMACLERGIAIRMAETFCEGVRYSWTRRRPPCWWTRPR